MIILAGALLIVGGLCVSFIKETYAEKHVEETDPYIEEQEPF